MFSVAKWEKAVNIKKNDVPHEQYKKFLFSFAVDEQDIINQKQTQQVFYHPSYRKPIPTITKKNNNNNNNNTSNNNNHTTTKPQPLHQMSLKYILN